MACKILARVFIDFGVNIIENFKVWHFNSNALVKVRKGIDVTLQNAFWKFSLCVHHYKYRFFGKIVPQTNGKVYTNIVSLFCLLWSTHESLLSRRASNILRENRVNHFVTWTLQLPLETPSNILFKNSRSINCFLRLSFLIKCSCWWYVFMKSFM